MTCVLRQHDRLSAIVAKANMIQLHEGPQMSEPTVTSATHASDPLKTAADAMSLAVRAARDGAADAQARVSEMMPAITGFVSRLTYTTSYALSYGIVFPTLLLAQAVPKNNALVHGLADGAHAARDAATGSVPHHGPASQPGPEAGD
jgi:uncharacterized protein (DUF1800 family)